eukprot:1268263-Pleurochrysis_carterae.AAC.3
MTHSPAVGLTSVLLVATKTLQTPSSAAYLQPEESGNALIQQQFQAARSAQRTRIRRCVSHCVLHTEGKEQVLGAAHSSIVTAKTRDETPSEIRSKAIRTSVVNAA